MSVATLQRGKSSAPVEVHVRDMIGQRWVALEDVDPETPVGEIVGDSRRRLDLSDEVDWQARHRPTARLLRRDLRIGDVATEGTVELTLQPDPRLG